MILCETGSGTTQAFDDLAVLVHQLRLKGLDACIPAASVPGDVNPLLRFALAEAITEGAPVDGDTVLVTHARDLADSRLLSLRAMRRGAEVRVVATGSWADKGAMISTRSKLSYVLGAEPHLVNLEGQATAHAPVVAPDPRPPRFERFRVLLVYPDLSNEASARAVASLAFSSFADFTVCTDGKSKQAFLARFGHRIPVFHLGEVMPEVLARGMSAAAFLARPGASFRLNTLVACLGAEGAALLDCAPAKGGAFAPLPFIPAPSEPQALSLFLCNQILPEMLAISAETAAAALPGAAGGAALLAALGAPSAPRRAERREEPETPQVLIVPTNGVGLGHAQRTSLIAGAMGDVKPVFAAFPSCMRMIRNYGFDVTPLVGRSREHASEHSNDLINHGRILPLLRQSEALVFDGGYVFNSIYQSILDSGKPAAWVRRGLWQAGQDNSIALDREKAFSRVIVPTECFEELNTSYSASDKVREVGPIVQKTDWRDGDRAAIRQALSERLGIGFEHLVVTMLGGGVAADRSAMACAIAAQMDRRQGVLNLVITWPTATLEAGLFGWRNTRVVKTHHAHPLVCAADLFISAVGYNSFHEAMYNAVPTIFVPQMAAYMDDQETRARAAAERGLAALAHPDHLQSMGREIGQMLDGGAQAMAERLRATILPEPGNAAAALAIEEMIQ